MSKFRNIQLMVILLPLASANLATAAHTADGLFNASPPLEQRCPGVGFSPPYLGFKQPFAPNAFQYGDQSAGVLYLMYDCH
jgi:hypothetical protein